MNSLFRHYIMLALIMACGVFPHGGANADDVDILDLIPFGAIQSGLTVEKTFICKSVGFLPLECGDGTGGFIDNFYVMFIDVTDTPSNQPLDLLLSGGGSGSFGASDCNADSIQNTIVGFSDLPASIQDFLTIPNGKKAVFHRVRVINGNGSLQVNAAQRCVIP
jgi:hypothetical protein